jgi:hypothetical protein
LADNTRGCWAQFLESQIRLKGELKQTKKNLQDILNPAGFFFLGKTGGVSVTGHQSPVTGP